MATGPAQFLGNTVGEAAAFAAGLAISPVLHPIVQVLANQAWNLDPTKPLDPGLVAEAVAHGHIAQDTGELEAALSGVSKTRFDELVKAAKTGPGVESAFALWRRGDIGDGQFQGALTRAGIEATWIDELMKLKGERLDPAVIALAIVRGIITDPGFLPVGPPSGSGKVKPFPVSSIDALTEAAAAGWDEERLFVQTAINGRPMGPEAAAASVFRNILERVDFDRAISEGDVRNEWADAIFEHARQIPSASNFVNWRLRGWTDDAGMHAGTARHGMSADDTKVLFETAGRPLSWHQVFIGLRRGGTYDGPIDALDPAFLKALRESDIRPEWYNLAWAQRFSYPTAFVLRSLTEGGDITEDEVHAILLDEGWEPALAAKVAAKWAAHPAAAAANPWVAKAESQLWTATHKAYVKMGVSQADATTALTHIVPDAPTRSAIFALWDAERVIQSAPSAGA